MVLLAITAPLTPEADIAVRNLMMLQFLTVTPDALMRTAVAVLSLVNEWFWQSSTEPAALIVMQSVLPDVVTSDSREYIPGWLMLPHALIEWGAGTGVGAEVVG